MYKLFQPQQDITAYELAIIATYLIGSSSVLFSPKDWANAPTQIQRHFVDQPGAVTSPPDQNGVMANKG